MDWLSNIFFGLIGGSEKDSNFQLANNLLCNNCTKNEKKKKKKKKTGSHRKSDSTTSFS